MVESEGVIKYRLVHTPGPLPADFDLAGLSRWFVACRQQGLIGRSPDRYEGYAYGNISVRAGRGFVISGTQTGGLNALSADHLAWVAAFDIDANRLEAGGPARPSSEAMTHGQVYRALPDVDAVIHVHSPEIWSARSRLGLACTPPEAAYGTVAMADEVARLLGDPAMAGRGIFAMGGHEDGIVAYGGDMDSAGALLLETLARARPPGD